MTAPAKFNRKVQPFPVNLEVQSYCQLYHSGSANGGDRSTNLRAIQVAHGQRKIRVVEQIEGVCLKLD